MDISKRLKTIAKYIPIGSRVADIGSDHALLPVYLVKNKIVMHAIAGELHTGPYQAAVNQVKNAGLEKKIEVRQGDGLSVITPAEVDCIVIAGMGGKLICKILDEGVAKLEDVRYLVLQPNVGEHEVRNWLIKQGWYLQDETILEEESHIYEVLFAVKHPDEKNLNHQLYHHYNLPCGLSVKDSDLIRLGPHLLRKSSELFIKKWKMELSKRKRIVQQMKQSSLQQAQLKKEQFEQEISELEEIIQCMQKVKL